jgi:hypothetical protein
MSAPLPGVMNQVDDISHLHAGNQPIDYPQNIEPDLPPTTKPQQGQSQGPSGIAPQSCQLGENYINMMEANFGQMNDALYDLHNLIARSFPQPDIWDTNKQLAVKAPILLNKQGRHYAYLFTGTTINNVNILVGGYGRVSGIQLNAGWTQILYPDQTEIELSTGNPINVLFLYTDFLQN